ncbi:unnamed protein product [Cochlearia groenlandica]
MEKPTRAMLPVTTTPSPNANATTIETQPLHSGVNATPKRKRNRKICICVSVTLLILLVVFIVLLVLALTLFKAKKPVTTVDSITVSNLRSAVDAANFRVVLNLTLHVDLTLKNPNRVGFSYDSTTALLNYRGQLIGEAPLPSNRIGSQETQAMNLTLTLLADRILSESQLFGDVIADVIPLNVFLKIAGKVNVFDVFKVKVESTSSCDMNVSVSNRNVTSQQCKSSTKL